MHYPFFVRGMNLRFAAFIFLGCLLLLAACQPAPTSVPQPLASPAFTATPPPAPSPTPIPSSATAGPREESTSAPAATPATLPASDLSNPPPEATQSVASPTEAPAEASPDPTQSVASPTPAQSAEPSASACLDKAAFYGDVTIPDDTNFEQAVSFTKTWRFRNEGDCTWDSSYAFVFSGGEILNAPLTAPLSVSVAPGEIANLSIDMRTPDRGGVFRSNWEFQNAQGVRFGTGAGGHDPFWVQVVVSWMPPGGGQGNSGGNAGGGSSGDSPANPPADPASGNNPPAPTPTPDPGSGSTPEPTPPPNNPGQGQSSLPGVPAGCNARDNNGFLQVLLGMINQARSENGLDPVSPSAPLYAAAAVHSADMACNNIASHIGSDGSSWYTRIAAQGYSYSVAVENIVFANPDFGGNAQYAYDWWMNSQVHRDNILNPKVTELGLGYVFNSASEYGGYFTLVLARPGG